MNKHCPFCKTPPIKSHMMPDAVRCPNAACAIHAVHIKIRKWNMRAAADNPYIRCDHPDKVKAALSFFSDRYREELHSGDLCIYEFDDHLSTLIIHAASSRKD